MVWSVQQGVTPDQDPITYKVGNHLFNLRPRLKERREVAQGENQTLSKIETRNSYHCQLLPGIQEDPHSEEVNSQLCGQICFEISPRTLIIEGERANFSYRLWFYLSCGRS